MIGSIRQRRSPFLFQFVVLALTIAPAIMLGTVAWRVCGPYGERCGVAGRFYPVYNPDTGRIDVVMHDLSGNGIVDTWVHRNDSRIEEIEIDQDEDGSIDRRLVPDEDGKSWRVETDVLPEASSNP